MAGRGFECVVVGRHAAVAAVRGVRSFQQHNLLVPVQILTRKLGEIEKKYGLADKSKVRFSCCH